MAGKTTHNFSSSIPRGEWGCGEIVQEAFDIEIKVSYDNGKNKEEIKEHLKSIFQEVLEYFD